MGSLLPAWALLVSEGGLRVGSTEAHRPDELLTRHSVGYAFRPPVSYFGRGALRVAPEAPLSSLLQRIATKKPGTRPGFLLLHLRAKRAHADNGQLFGSHLFGFAFLAHHFQLAFRGFELCVDFLLDALCRFFQFR